jgi:uncharacterized protein
MKQIKLSHYSILIPIEDLENEYLIYNTATGGIEVLNNNEGILIEEMRKNTRAFYLDNGSGDSNELFTRLYKKGYLVDYDLDERKKLYDYYRKKRGSESINKRKYGSIGLTIGTTMICNMGCSYCFEFVKPNRSLKDPVVIDQIETFVRDVVSKSDVEKWRNIAVTWYGGEPLVNKRAIEMLTPKLKDICKELEMDYDASIITNGVLLDEDTWQLLLSNNVDHVQITIDGAREVHDNSRPLKGNSTQKSYFKILENISKKPDGIKLTIRINVDRKVAQSLPLLVQDLQTYGIWPSKYKTVNLEPAWLRTYEEANESDTNDRLDVDEYFDVLKDFRILQVQTFNQYAEENNLKKAKLKWLAPTVESECNTWVSPFSFVIDPEGYIHKCWETIHDRDQSINHVSDGYNLDQYKNYITYDRFDINDTCYNCKYLPVCDQLSCSVQAEKHRDNPPCTHWKTRTIPTFREQYIMMKKNPDLIDPPFRSVKENTGHSNK